MAAKARSHVETGTRPYVFLSEWTLPYLLVLVFRRRRPVILRTLPTLSPLGGLLDRLVRVLRKRGLVETLEDSDPAAERKIKLLDYYRPAYGYKHFDWLINQLSFQAIDSRLAEDYLRPVKHELLKSVWDLLPDLHVLRLIAAARQGQAIRVIGAPTVLAALVDNNYRCANLSFSHALPRGAWVWINALSAVAALGAGMVDMLSRARRRLPPSRRYRVGFDFAPGGAAARHIRFLDELGGGGEDVLVVFRSRHAQSDPASIAAIGSASHCVGSDAAISWRELGPALARLLRDGLGMMAALAILPPDAVFRLFLLPARRQRIIAFLRRTPCDVYWGKDDYNVEHILRTQEMRRIGAKSVGIAHGILCYGIIEWMAIYIDFDTYFVFAERFHDKYYKQFYNPAMKLVPVGSVGMSRELLARLDHPRPADIALYIDPMIDDPHTLTESFRLAEALPDQTLHIRLKPGREDTAEHAEMVRYITGNAPANVRISDLDSYELMLHVSYGISTLSTVAAELVQFGVVTFVLDDPAMDVVYYREFPGLCVGGFDTVIARIRDHRRGDWQFPRDSYAELIEMKAGIPFDVIRKEMGLAPLPSTMQRPDACTT